MALEETHQLGTVLLGPTRTCIGLGTSTGTAIGTGIGAGIGIGIGFGFCRCANVSATICHSRFTGPCITFRMSIGFVLFYAFVLRLLRVPTQGI